MKKCYEEVFSSPWGKKSGMKSWLWSDSCSSSLLDRRVIKRPISARQNGEDGVNWNCVLTLAVLEKWTAALRLGMWRTRVNGWAMPPSVTMLFSREMYDIIEMRTLDWDIGIWPGQFHRSVSGGDVWDDRWWWWYLWHFSRAVLYVKVSRSDGSVPAGRPNSILLGENDCDSLQTRACVGLEKLTGAIPTKVILNVHSSSAR